ncbi:hypothetical protein I316_02927 [Kwoniella heveanensis BCC8398]|uniref:Uncharacterized protein n=1 Tax=Kwoniella heveanensis BCC8398 TaxID=1296120 RepID=A0A1B9GWF9_9TREE|nr:hypothetical protein I316_02927 [Kwoniella heveanensis BCC8398]
MSIRRRDGYIDVDRAFEPSTPSAPNVTNAARVYSARTHKSSKTQDRITFAPPPAGPYSTLTLYAFSISMCLISALSFLLGVSYIYCPGQAIPLLQPICEDNHYRYIVPLLVPVTAWFAIANWVGWEYFRYA